MKIGERTIYLTGIGLMVAGCIFVGWRWRSAEVHLATAQRGLEPAIQAEQNKSASEIARVKTENEDLKAQVAKFKGEQETAATQPIVQLNQVDIAELKTLGLKEPTADLLADLEKRNDLIPYDGVLGGTMYFHPAGDWVINRHWLLARFDDGHTGGWAILKYEVTNGRIKWTVLETGHD